MAEASEMNKDEEDMMYEYMPVEYRPQAKIDFSRPNEYEVVEYVIRDGKKHPVAIIAPGGGYSCVCSFVEGKPFAEYLNSKGISAFVVYYRVREFAVYPNPQDDLARAVRYVMSKAEEYNLDMEHYSVWGSSAGGHLAGSFGTDNMGYVKYGLPKPAALVLIYPVVTMGPETHEGTRECLIGKEPSEEMIAYTSNEKHVSAYPDTFVWCGDADTCVPPANSKMLNKALDEAGIRHEFVLYPGIEHGVGLGTGQVCEGWIDRAIKFWLG